MQKTFLLTILITLIISCNKDKNVNIKPGHSNSFIQPATWQEQVNYAKSNTVTKNVDNEICLIGHAYKGKIKEEAEIPAVIEQLFSDSSSIALCTPESNYEIISLQAFRQFVKKADIDDPFEKIKSQLEVLIQVGVELIELEWSYKGNTFYSLAIASNDLNGIIYDHIGHMIVDDAKSNLNKIESNIPIVKTKSESGTGLNQNFNKEAYAKNTYGLTVWEYRINCTSTFDTKNILVDRNLSAYRYSCIGYSCVAEIKTIGGEIDSSKYHEFGWRYAYGNMVSATMEWNGNGFSISGASTGETGTQVHRPS